MSNNRNDKSQDYIQKNKNPSSKPNDKQNNETRKNPKPGYDEKNPGQI